MSGGRNLGTIQRTKPAREKILGPVEIPLSSANVCWPLRQRKLTCIPTSIFAQNTYCSASSRREMLRAEILHEQGVRLAQSREELLRIPHDDSAIEEFVRERGSRPEDVAEMQDRIRSIKSRVEEAIAQNDFVAARAYSDEEGRERDKLFLLYQQHGLVDWIYD